MDIERRTPGNTAIVLIDYVTGFANLFRSQSVQENVSGAVALAKTAVGYGVPLVVSTGPDNDPRGPLYPEVAAVIGDHPVIHRGGSFDAFDFPGFEAAVAETGRSHLDNADTVGVYFDIQMQAPGFAKNLNTLAARAAPRTA